MSIVNWEELARDVERALGEGFHAGYMTGGGEVAGHVPEFSATDARLALHGAVGTGRASLLYDMSGEVWAVFGLENRGQIIGGVVSGPWGATAGMEEVAERLEAVAQGVHRRQGWRPELIHAHRVSVGRTRQYYRSVEEQRRQGLQALYDFEQERVLLAAIRAGDRESSRMMLNELLTPIFMDSVSLVVLQARAVELVTRLTRAALEDNPMLTVLWGRWKQWTGEIVMAESIELIARVVMKTLEGFIEGVFVHGGRAGSVHVHRALAYISDHYAQPISLREVSREVGISPSRLAHLFREDVGRTVLEVIHEVRVRRARGLLEHGDRNCAEIAYEVGYSDQSYFTRVFRRLVGVTPMRYRTAGLRR